MTIRVKKYLVDAQMAAERISEFLKERIQEDLELDLPELWQIIGLRNRIAHGYDTLNYELLWTLAQTRLPLLQQHLIELL